MILPTVHRSLQRGDLARLVAEIARGAPDAAGPAVEALETGDVDALLDQSAALDAVRGFGGAPAPLPLTLLWYVPVRAALREPRLERAIGVIYRPQTERWSHYFHTRLSDQFDVVLHFDETRAVEPLERTPAWVTGEPPETYPTGI